MNDPSTDLDRLHDLVLPPEISWWPLAPGWYFVAVAVLIVLGVLGFRCFKRWRANAYRRAALHELESASDLPSIAAILRRTALVAEPRSFVAGKTGASWVEWLASAISHPMPDEVRDQLANGIYDDSRRGSDFSSLRRYAEQWIVQHPATEGAEVPGEVVNSP